MNKTLFTRIAFVTLLVVSGFALERAWQSWQSRSSHESAVDTGDGRDRVVLVGGSVVRGMASVLQSHLRAAAKRETIDVIEQSLPWMSIDDAGKVTSLAIEKFRPRAVVMMIGLSESKHESNEWNAVVKDLDARREHRALATMLNLELAKGKMLRTMVFVTREKRRLQLEGFDRHFVPVVTDQVDSFVAQGLDETSRSRALWSIATALSTIKRNEINFESPKISDNALADYLRNRIRELGAYLEVWKNEVKAKDYRAFVRTDDPFEGLLRRWFWITWETRDKKKDRDVIKFYVDNPVHLTQVVPGFYKFRARRQVAALLQKDVSKGLMRALERVSLDDVQAAFPTKALDSSATDRLKQILNSVKARSVTPVLLHYPAWETEALTNVARESGVTVAGDGDLLESLIAKNGRDLYFMDHMGRTGHLTDAGLEIYCRAIAAKIVGAIGDSK